jgi:uncharacterized protein (TIGR02449 family)
MDFSILFNELEEHAELLIETCKHLKQENYSLQEQVATLTHECSELKKRNALIAEQISKIIYQLKAVDRTEHSMEEVETL